MQPRRFRDFMEDALYGPTGYYNAGHAQTGRLGDYFTAVDVGPMFGRLLAALFSHWQTKMGWEPFSLIEAAAGEGHLARTVLQSLDPKRFPYYAIERSQARRVRCQTVTPFVFSSIEDLPKEPRRGCFFANELIDAFPVHRVRRHQNKWEEAYVDRDKNEWIWQSASTLEIEHYFDRLKLFIPDGYETEINLDMRSWVARAAQTLTEGFFIWIDYGRPAHAYYAPERSTGTLRAFYNHQVTDAVLLNPGQQDLTADVDFTSLALDAREAGLEPLAFYELSSFLLQAAAVLPPTSFSDADARAIQFLTHPEGMGSAFHVLIAGKGLGNRASGLFDYNRIRRLGIS